MPTSSETAGRFVECLKIVGLCIAAAVAYGILHDLVTANICVEYFTVGHPDIFHTQNPWLLALGWGVVATWWVGLPLGVLLAAAAQFGHGPRRSAASLLPLLARLLGVMFACAVLAGVMGGVLYAVGAIRLVPELARRIPEDRQGLFLIDGFAHSASYLVGGLGGLFLVSHIWRERGRLAVPSPPKAAPVRCLIVIPARYASTRLPRKMLLAETGKPLIQHTYEAALRARQVAGVCVATDHADIFAAVRAFGGEVEMTDPAAASGTDRVAEIARRRPQFNVLVNVQGDEPEIAAESIDRLVQLMEQNPHVPMATLATPIRSADKLQNPNCVKVVCDQSGRALYFSRAPIPFARDGAGDLFSADPPVFLQHLGLYAYRREFLLQLSELPLAPLEQIEKLEQLRVLAAGYAILVGIVEHHAAGIDTPEDYRAFVSRTAGQ